MPCLDLFTPEVARIRVDLLQALRDLHAEQSRLDGCSGQTSITTAFQVRLGWARGSWMTLMEGAAAFLNGDRAWLQKVGALPDSGRAAMAECPQHGRHGLSNRGIAAMAERQDPPCTCQVDEFLLDAVEGIARVFFGLVARTWSLWSGGCYGLIKMLSERADEVAAILDRAQRLWPRLLAFEQEMAAGAGRTNSGMQAFEDGLLWPTGVAWREMHGLLAEGRVEEALVYIWRVHSGKYHDKGTQSHAPPPPHPTPQKNMNDPWGDTCSLRDLYHVCSRKQKMGTQASKQVCTCRVCFGGIVFPMSMVLACTCI